MIRRPIQQLSPALVNRIAAGEVIERPASVVKELIDNALDAGATRITIEIEDGGRQLIRLIDDGSGIPEGDLPLAFASHATSKLLDDDDLFRINTMGFRGEALASIGAVSHARIVSRTADGVAHEIQNRGGEIGAVQAAAANVGTTVEVRNLFFNVPARRRFLKGTTTEFGYISDAVLRAALPYPSIEFRLLHHGRLSLHLPIVADADERLLAGWPDEFRDGRMSIDSGDGPYRLRGLIGTPECARPVLKYQHFYLNGRAIRDKTVQHALREAYRGLTEPGRHPAAVLMLSVPSGDVDVNVHPTKSEVRFRDGTRVYGLVMASVREQLIGSNLAPRAAPRIELADDPVRQNMQERLAAFFKGSLAGKAVVDERGEVALEAPVTVPAVSSVAPMEQFVGAKPQVAIPAMKAVSNSAAIQLHNSYLVAESDDGLIIIDQHALHERIMFEELLARVTAGPLESQRLLIPRTLPATARQMAMLEQIQPLLARIGIEVAPFGPDVVAIQSFPSFLDKLEPADFIAELVDRGETELQNLSEEELLHEVLDMMSCKAAVKAGDPLTPGEIEALLARRELVERSSNCPHGRPTTLRLSLRDLEKQFKRTGF
ncbi:MAG: DNA mismatch repair endonuclease MutL [Phycisphaerae bacterium]|nr:DNA mismatch repair endonuclease MutL [Phycisphaerae bacterium]